LCRYIFLNYAHGFKIGSTVCSLDPADKKDKFMITPKKIEAVWETGVYVF